MWLRNLLHVVGILCLLAWGTFGGLLAYQTWIQPPRIEKAIAERVDSRLTAVDSKIDAVGTELVSTIREVRTTLQTVQSTVKQLSDNADKRIGEAILTVNTAVDKADTQLTAVNESARVLVDAAKPTLDNFARSSAVIDSTLQYNLNCKGNGACWPSGVTATLGGLKMTLGESAQAMRRFDASLPVFLAQVERIGVTFEQTGNNVARWTKPDKAALTGAKIAAPFAGAMVGAYIREKGKD